MSETILRRFLRYEISSYLIFLYCILLLLPFIDFGVVSSSVESDPVTPLFQLVLAAVGLFIVSGVVGYVLYQIYDTYYFPKQKDIMLSNILYNRFIPHDNDWEKARAKLLDVSERDIELAHQLINYSLYVTDKDKPLDSKALDTIRGFWGHLQARIVGSWAIIPAYILFAISVLFLNQVEGLIILNVPKFLIFLIPSILIISFSYFLWSGTDVILERIWRFVFLVLRHNLKNVNEMLDKLSLQEKV